jgi:hypothetical protein
MSEPFAPGIPFQDGGTPGQACDRTAEGQPGAPGSPPFCEEQPVVPPPPPVDPVDPVDPTDPVITLPEQPVITLPLPIVEEPCALEDRSARGDCPGEEPSSGEPAPVIQEPSPVDLAPPQVVEATPITLQPLDDVPVSELPVTGAAEVTLGLIGAVLVTAGIGLLRRTAGA